MLNFLQKGVLRCNFLQSEALKQAGRGVGVAEAELGELLGLWLLLFTALQK